MSKVDILRSALKMYEWFVEQGEAERIQQILEKDGSQHSRLEVKWFLKL